MEPARALRAGEGRVKGRGGRRYPSYRAAKDKDTAIARLRAAEIELRGRGVLHAALFGSRARGDARADGDTDILIDLDPMAELSVYDYVGLKRLIASLWEGPVDAVDHEGLRPYVGPPAERDAISAF